MSKAKVLSGDERYAAMLDCGAKLVSKFGAANVTRRMVAKACKCSEGLVAHYMGPTADAQKLYAKQAKKLGLPLPTKDQAEAIGAKLRAHGPRKAPVKRTTRKRSVKEVQAIKKAVAKKSAPAALVKAVKTTKVLASPSAPKTPRKAGAAKKPRGTGAKNTIATNATVIDTPAKATGRSTAARKPKAPPTLPPLPLDAALPPLPLDHLPPLPQPVTLN